MIDHHDEPLSDDEVTQLLRLLEQHHPVVPAGRDALLSRVLREYDRIEFTSPKTEVQVVEDERAAHIEPRRHLVKWLAPAMAAAIAAIAWTSTLDAPTTAVIADTPVTIESEPPRAGDRSADQDRMADRDGVQSFDFASGVNLSVPDGMVVIDESSRQLVFARADGLDLSNGRISLVDTSATDIDDEVVRLVDEGVVVVNEGRIRVGGELRPRWEVVVSNATAQELGCVGVAPCLQLETDGVDLILWSGVPNIMTSLEVEPDRHAVWLVRPEGYLDTLALDISREMLNSASFDQG